MSADVVIITRDRPGNCVRCVESVLERTSARSVTILDGTPPENETSGLYDVVTKIGRRTRKCIRYIGWQERSSISQEIHRDTGVDLRVVSFGISETSDAFSAGSARNTSLLLFKGRKFVMLDDDVVPLTATHDDAQRALYVNEHFPRFYTYHFPTRSAALRSAQWTKTDIISEFSIHLNRSVAETIANCNLQVKDCGIRDIEHLRLAAVQCGTIGDSGSYSGDWMPSQPGNFINCTRSYLKTAVTSREVISIPSAAFATRAPMCMAIALGVNNESGLPPFMPRYRNEDGVFAHLAAVSCPHNIFLHLPLAVLHDAPTGRKYSRSVSLRMSEMVIEAVESMRSACSDSSRAESLVRIGRALQAVCRSRVDFKYTLGFWAEQVMRAKEYSAMRMADQSNDLIRQHAMRLLNDLAVERTKTWWIVPNEMRGIEPIDGIEQVRRFMESIGSLLEAWTHVCGWRNGDSFGWSG